MKKLFSALLLCGCSLTAIAAQPKNIIMIIGDGMGPAYTTAYRYFKDDQKTEKIEETIFDRTLVGMSSTYPARISGYVTDSAAGATALATGHKTYNGAIAVTVNKKPVETVLERAKKLGKSIGVVVTSQVNHATPAGYLAHNESRQNYNEIADSYIDNGWKTDILLGGGWKYFIRDDRNLVKEIQKQGVYYVDDYRQLATLPTDKPIFGLFADIGLPWALDDKNSNRLSTMTQAATQHLIKQNNPNGFFMLIEGSQIDWGGHGNDIVDTMAEMNDLAKTLEYLEGFVKQHPDTLVIVTADHSTGGLTIAANGKYEWNPELIRAMTKSINTIAKQLYTKKITKKLVKTLFNFELNATEINQLIETKKHPHKNNDHNIYADNKTTAVEQALLKTIINIINVRTNTGWTSSGHTAVDVPVFAFGASKELFYGFQDDTDIAKKIFSLLKK
ncbi:MAG: alkaline phosphatase [Gammaproteobacteria bacterium]|nr:MAG: alkaline phosphatase [Gammaproteobacteria bacterium]